MVIKVLFALLIVCTAALVAVGIAILVRVRRHLKQEHVDAQVRSVLDEAAEKALKKTDVRNRLENASRLGVRTWHPWKFAHSESMLPNSGWIWRNRRAIVICASTVIAVCARLVFPLPFTPVPLTLANFGVLLVGLTLGSKRGFAAAALYLAWGAMGLPVFSPSGVGGIAQIARSNGRISVAYPVVAFIAGWLSERGVPVLRP